MSSLRKFLSVCATMMLVIAGLASDSVVSPVMGDESDKSFSYDQVWQQVSQLLAVREYSSAAEVIEDAEQDSDLKSFRDRLALDRKDIERLQYLAAQVREQASKLKPGDPLKVGSTEYKVVRFVTDAAGDRLELESSTSSSKTEKALAQLDPKSWLALAQPKLTTSAEDRYIVGMFQASVEHGDRKAARQALNLAATDKISVTHWTARIDAEAQAIEDERDAKKAALDDKILGTWRMVIGEGKGERRINITFRPRGKTDNQTSTWRKAGEDRYVLSAPKGGTAHFKLGPKGEGFKGTLANGTPVKGFRQAKAKR